MFALHCTKKLLKRLDVPRNERAPRSATTTRLGDWVANFLIHDRQPIVLAASTHSLLPIVMRLAPAKTFAMRFPDAVEQMLARIGVSAEKIAGEREAMNLCVVESADIADRILLGQLVDFARLLGHQSEPSLIDAAVRISDAPCSPIKMNRPRDVARVLFEL